MNLSLNNLYSVLGISKQAVHKYAKRQQKFDILFANLVMQADELRDDYPGCGVEKMYYTLSPGFMGRDKFIESFMELGYKVKKQPNYRRTTIPSFMKYPNLIEGMVIANKNTVWQSDITYYQVGGRYYYLVFIIDVYTRQIVGFSVSDNLRAEANIKALKMAYTEHGVPKIHHSDRGSQYIDKRYTHLLSDNNVKISMGMKAQDNAYAERINGIIKNDYLKHWKIKTFRQLKARVRKAVNHYNEKRIHGAFPDRISPNQFDRDGHRYKIVEEIYAPERPFPRESTFSWEKELKKKYLFCNIN